MKVHNIPFKETGYFSNLIEDYLDEKENLKSFYGNFSNLDGFKKQINLKESSFKKEVRNTLVKALEKQYENTEISDYSFNNIKSLKDSNTFTITTGHQLNIFTGPLYFLYKIVSVINLTKELKNAFPSYNFVPVYWMATEDHDFEEINFFNFKNKKVSWNKESKGAVGRLNTTAFDVVLKQFSSVLGGSKNEKYLAELFEESYINHSTLTEATRFLVNELFGTYGLVIIDGDDALLKKEFAPIVKDELLNKTSYKEVLSSSAKLGKSYAIQVNPRVLNLFYLKDNLRERILLEGNFYKINNTNLEFSEDEILNELAHNPERFSPNVIMRPLYQETILPNLGYIGGGGELAYWFQLKQYFDKVQTPFPILLLRNSVLLASSKQLKKLEKLNVSLKEVFLKQDALVDKKVKEISNIVIDFSDKKEFLTAQFASLKKLAKETDTSFIGAVKAQEQKQLNGLDKLEKRLLKAQKRKLKDQVDRLRNIQDELFPNGSLEERHRNFSEMYIELGESFIPELLENLKPLELKFTVLEY